MAILTKRTYQAYQIRKGIEVRIQSLQHCCFKSLNDREICIDEFDPNQSIMIIYFHPECEHCQYEAKEIGLHANEFANVNMLMITPDDSLQRIENFAEENHLWELSNLELLMDAGDSFRKYFGTAKIPTVFIYKNNKLLKKYSGETKIEAILEIINNSKN
ncbi:MAG: redoxin domain-containing protein [Prolixibacteraceae bacterium]|jgi:peroxiredoxin|nr:redoxin domain-containing protein [Prolixibacteraceae bacterium]